MYALILATLLGASGDAIYIFNAPGVTLNGAQKTAAANFATAQWPGIVLANVDRVYCLQGRDASGGYNNAWQCEACDERTVAASGWLDLEDQGKTGRLKRFVAGTATYSDCHGRASVNAANRALLSTFVDSWTGTALDQVVDLVVWRPDPAVPSRVDAQANIIKTAAPSTYLTDLNAAQVIRRIGRVP